MSRNGINASLCYRKGDHSSVEVDDSLVPGCNHTNRLSFSPTDLSQQIVTDDNKTRGETNITENSEFEQQQHPSAAPTASKYDGDADTSTTSSSSDTRSYAEELDEDDASIAKPSLCVRIIDINCPLPPKLREITSSIAPAIHLGLVKESNKSDFLCDAKPKMSRTVITSSQVINRVEEVRWDNLHKNSLEDLFLGVELRIWGWFPEVVENCKELMDEEEEREIVAAAHDTLKIVDEMEGEHHQDIKDHHESGMSYLGGSHKSHDLAKVEMKTENQAQQQHSQHQIEEKRKKDGSSQEEPQHQPPTTLPPSRRRSREKFPSIRLGTLLIPIHKIWEGITFEKSYSLDFKVSGGTRDTHKSIEKLLGVEQPVLTLKLEIQVSPSFQELNISEDILLLQNLKSLKSHLLRDDKGSTLAEDCEEDKEADEKFIEQNVVSSMISNTESVASSNMADQQSTSLVAPVLNPGIIDAIFLMGPRDIDKLSTHDDGKKGWLPTCLNCSIIEKFSSQAFYPRDGRDMTLLEEVGDAIAWWCFPEGCQAWRGIKPPSAADMNLPPRNGDTCEKYNTNSVRSNSANSSFFQSSPIGSSQVFDDCFKCTTTFTWFLFKSKSNEVAISDVNNYVVCIRFFVPALYDIDHAQHDDHASSSSKKKRDVLWIPSVLCAMTTLPIIGVVEAVLMRMCQSLHNHRPQHLTLQECFKTKILKDLANLIVNYPAPIHGVLNCSMPFLQGQRLHVGLPPLTGLPPLPHGGSVTAVCRLLGAEGFIILLAAFLTECKILLHSHDISNLTMVAEVFYALIFPFQHDFTYIPVLPEKKLEFIEAPGIWLFGVSSKVMKWVDRSYLSDVVVIDLDNGFHTPDYFDGNICAYELPSPLPAPICQSIRKGIFHLLRQEENIEEQYRKACYPSALRFLPRLENESRAERGFRVDVAIQICSLLRGYQDCLLSIGDGQPLFIHDKFLRYAPASLEYATPISSSTTEQQQTQATNEKIVSPRAKGFLSLLVRTQHFQSLLERLQMEELDFFHEIMDTFEWDEEGDQRRDGLSNKTLERRKDHLSALLEKTENSIPTYRIDRRYFDKCLQKISLVKDKEKNCANFEGEKRPEEDNEDGDGNDDDLLYESSETSADGDYDDFDLYEDDLNQNYDNCEEYCREKCLVELDENTLRYERIFPTKDEYEGIEAMTDTTLKMCDVCPKITLRQAIGEQRYNAYCIKKQKRSGLVVNADKDDESISHNAMDKLGSPFRNIDDKNELTETTDVATGDDDKFLDFNTLLSLAREEMLGLGLDITPSDIAHEPIYQCLSLVHDTKNEEWIQNSEKALRSPSTFLQSQTFLLCVLSQRNHVNYPSNIMEQSSMHRIAPYQQPRHQGVVGGVGTRSNPASFHRSSSNLTGSAVSATSSNLSKLTPPTFETLIRLCSSMLDVCLERDLYENAYRLLSDTAEFYCIGAKATSDRIYMAATISMHPIFTNIQLWEKVLILHIKDQYHQTTSASSVFDTTSTTTILPADNPNLSLIKKSKQERASTTSQQQAAIGAYSFTDTKNESEHDAVVTTLTEMLEFGVPAEELARFATRVSEARNWFTTERGKNLVVLAKVLGLRRVTTDNSQPKLPPSAAMNQDVGAASDVYGNESDGVQNMNSKEYLELIGSYHPTAGITSTDDLIKNGVLSLSPENKFEVQWEELSWFHPTSVDWSGKNASSSLPSIPQHPNVTLPKGYTGRTPITSIGDLSSHSCIATGGLDGSVFLAHTLSFGSPENGKKPSVRGVRLEWDSASSPFADTNTQQPYLSNAVSCLASSIPAQHYKPYSDDPDEILRSLDGCFIIAGTYAGSLNVWNAHDIYDSTVVASRNQNLDGDFHDRNLTTSAASILSNATASTANASFRKYAKQVQTRRSSEKKSGMALRGKALCGHKRGVLCIDVPSPIYRPDTVVTGGADGQIKLWSLRNTVSTSSLSSSSTPAVAAMFAGKGQTTASIGIPSGSNNAETEMASSNTDSCVSALSGHKGKVLCLRTYWHGDQLLSGGSDKTVRLWDLSASSSTSANRCLQKFACHSGDVTQVHYCGPHTIVSASTDRTIAICDARVGALPVHVLRYHKSHVSDLLLGSQSDNTMISASGDGTIATWDLRSFQTSNVKKQQDLNDIQILRSPVAVMKHSTVTATNKSITGSIKLSRGILSDKTIFSASIDGIVKEWNISSGVCIGDIHTGHSGAISCLSSYSQQRSSYYPKHDQFSLDSSLDDNLSTSLKIDESISSSNNNMYCGLLTCGWDGSIRFRKCDILN